MAKKPKTKIENHIRNQKKYPSTSNNLLQLELRQLSLTTVEITGDGNCMFRSLADQLHGSQKNYAKVRADICQYMNQNPEDFAAFMEHSLESHLAQMRKDKTYGENFELVATSRLYQADICVYQAGLGHYSTVFDAESTDVKNETLRVAYHHEYEHYSSIRNIDGPFIGLPMITIRRFSSTVTAQALKDAKVDQYMQMENIVKKSVELTEEEEGLLSGLLDRFRGNPGDVVDHILEERAVKETVAVIEAVKESDATVKEESVSADQVAIESSDMSPADANDKIQGGSLIKAFTPRNDKKSKRNAKIIAAREARNSKKAGPLTRKTAMVTTSKDDVTITAISSTLRSIQI